MYTDPYSNETPLGPSMATVRARHRAVLTKRCGCGRLRDPVTKSVGSRVWIACKRCLGTVRQIS